AAARGAEEHVEDVAEALGAEPAESRVSAADAGVAVAIVVRAFRRIRKHFIGFVDLFEVRFGRDLVVRDVGVEFSRELTVGTLDGALVRVPRDPENLVIIDCHYLPYFDVVEVIAQRARGPR